VAWADGIVSESVMVHEKALACTGAALRRRADNDPKIPPLSGKKGGATRTFQDTFLILRFFDMWRRLLVLSCGAAHATVPVPTGVEKR